MQQNLPTQRLPNVRCWCDGEGGKGGKGGTGGTGEEEKEEAVTSASGDAEERRGQVRQHRQGVQTGDDHTDAGFYPRPNVPDGGIGCSLYTRRWLEWRPMDRRNEPLNETQTVS